LPVRRLIASFFCLAICTLFAAAAPGDDDLWNLPSVERVAIPQPDLSVIEFDSPGSNCSVAPLPEISDSEAVRFETEDGPDTGGLLPAMADALAKFRRLVTSAGGSFDLKSAYRPIAYQEHLQQVWFKWMRELRYNRRAGCQALRSQVEEEFNRHKLMPTQMPVTDSDHTRGMAFDAAISMPRVFRYVKVKKRRVSVRVGVSLDRLALEAGLRRPDIRHDPVHYKLVLSASMRTQVSE
jgi:D-alanyl-D-alanine dipeptidase